MYFTATQSETFCLTENVKESSVHNVTLALKASNLENIVLKNQLPNNSCHE